MPREIIRSIDKLKHFAMIKESLSLENKRKLLKALKLIKECASCGCGIKEDIIDEPERNPVAKTFDTQADFASYVKQRRGIEITSKEQQALLGHTQRPTHMDKFSVTYEVSDSFGDNTTTTIKKLVDDSGQFCWTTFTKHEKAGGQDPEMNEVAPTPSANPQAAVTANDSIRVVKSVPFKNDTEGSDLLADLLNSEHLDI